MLRRRSPSLLIRSLMTLLLALMSAAHAGAVIPVESLNFPASTRGLSPGWSTQVIHEGKLFAREGDRYLRVDGQGRVHLAYGGDHLYYALQDETGWHIEVVDATPSEDASLVLDPGGGAVIAYYDRWNADLKLARAGDSGWQLEVVDAAGDVGRSASLVVDATGGVQVAYLDATAAAVKVATLDSAGWRSSLVDRARTTGQRVSLAAAQDGALHVAYFDELDQIRHAWLEGKVWRLSPPVAHATSRDLSLAVGAAGQPALLYAADYGALVYAELDGASWATTVVDEERHVDSVSLVFDAAGSPVFAAASPRRTDEYDPTALVADAFVWHGGRAEGTWWLDAVEAGGRAPDVTLDSTGSAHVALFRGEEALEVAASGPLGGWSTEVVDFEEPLSGPVFLAIDGASQPHLAYSDDAVRHVWQAGAAWEAETLPVTDPATLRAFGVDSLGQPRLVLHETGFVYSPQEPFNSITLLERFGTEWQSQNLEGYWGAGPALAVDRQDRTHVAFAYNSLTDYPPYLPEHELRYFGPAASGVTTLGSADSGVSIITDSAGRPHVSSVLLQEHWQGIDYRYFDGSAWRHETVLERDPAIERVTQIQLDAQGDPAILYWRDDDMMLARRKAGQWRSELVVPGVGVTGHLAFDSGGRGHIVFWSDGWLKHLVQDGESWSAGAIAAAPHGVWAAFVITPDDRLMLAYLEPLSNQLRLATAPAQAAAIYLPLVTR